MTRSKRETRTWTHERLAEAERHFSAGLALNPFSDPCYYYRAVALLGQGKPKEALHDVDRAIEIDSRREYHQLQAEILRDTRPAGRGGSRPNSGIRGLILQLEYFLDLTSSFLSSFVPMKNFSGTLCVDT